MNRYVNGETIAPWSAAEERVKASTARLPDAIPDPHKFSNVVQAAEANLSCATNLHFRLQKAMDFICGPTPQAPENPAPVEEFHSALDVINERQRQTYVWLDKIDNELRRLERVVG